LGILHSNIPILQFSFGSNEPVVRRISTNDFHNAFLIAIFFIFATQIEDMQEENFDHIVYSKNVIEFATVANEYCLFLEKINILSRKEFLEKIQKLLPLLYLKASLIPEVNDENTETPEKCLTEVDYNFLLNKLNSKMGPHDNYLEVFDPGMQFSETPIEASISENLCDIYQDLKDFIFAFRMGTIEIMTDAIWECKKNFNEFWGQKLVNGLRAIHSLLYGEIDLSETQDRFIPEKTNEGQDKSWVSKHFNNPSDEEELFSDDI
jgi:hypothetical protein